MENTTYCQLKREAVNFVVYSGCKRIETEGRADGSI